MIPIGKKKVCFLLWANDGKNINQVSLFFSGAGWTDINFTSTDFRVLDLDRNVKINISSINAHSQDGFNKLQTKPYTAPPKNIGIPRFTVQVRLPDPMPKNFKLSSPTIVIDGEEMKFPSILFEQKTWVGVSPLNC